MTKHKPIPFKKQNWDTVYPGVAITPEQSAFGNEMAAYQRRTGIRYPSACDILREAKRIGYRKLPIGHQKAVESDG